MSNKTCGECRYMLHKDTFEVCTHSMTETSMFDKACEYFAPPTNGDVIRQGGNRALLDYRFRHKCDVCIYAAPIDAAPACNKPDDKSCMDGVKAWLNAPAESNTESEE